MGRGGGQVGGDGTEGSGGRFLLLWLHPGAGPRPPAREGGCWKVRWGLGTGLMEGLPGPVLQTLSGSRRLLDPPDPKTGSLALRSASSGSPFQVGQK